MFGRKEIEGMERERNEGFVFPSSDTKREGKRIEVRTPPHFVQNKSFQHWRDLEGKHTDHPSCSLPSHSPSPIPFLPNVLSQHN